MNKRVFAILMSLLLLQVVVLADENNVVFHEGFEGDVTPKWDKVDGKFWQISKQAIEGSQAMQRVIYAKTPANAHPAQIKQLKSTPIPKGKFGLEVATSGCNETGVPIRQTVALEFYDAASKHLGTQEFEVSKGSSGYKKSIFEVTPIENATKAKVILRVYVTAPIGKTAFVKFDDLKFVEQAKLPAPVVKKENTIDLEAESLDLTFENNGSGWQGIDGKYFGFSESSKSGKYALRYVTFSKTPPAEKFSKISAKVPFVIKGDVKYRLSAFVRTNDKDNATLFEMAIRFFNDKNELISEDVLAQKMPPSPQFSEISKIILSPENATTAKLEVRFRNTQSIDNTLYFMIDDIKFVEFKPENYRAKITVPKPANPLVLEDPNSGKETKGSLSIGKFYHLSRPNIFQMSDINGGRFTNGSKLTDGTKQLNKNFKRDLFLGWDTLENIDITIDLGAEQTLEEVILGCFFDDEGALRLPENIKIYTKNANDADWKLWQDYKNQLKAQKSDIYNLVIKGKATKAHLVKLAITPNQISKNGVLAIDEIELIGTIKNTWKYVPKNGAYHGAFPPTYSVAKAERAGRTELMSLEYFEKLATKKCSMVLWYQGISPDRKFAELQKFRNEDLSENYYGQRFLSVGWLPAKGVKLEDIISGKLDDYFYEYFSDSMNDDITLGDHSPIWFRPMNEFNSFWVNWGLDPDNFKLAWRRIFNIAEQVGATKRHIFVWAPNHRSYPDEAWNKMEHYYPGDQYVDWVGNSCYPPSLRFVASEKERYAIGRSKEVNDKYGHYKPMMIAEGGYSDSIDRSLWVKEYFDYKNAYPSFKAMIWENHNDRVLQSDDKARKLYQELVQDPYWISETYIAE